MTKFKKHIIVVGTARSGTSWLAETISRQHRYRMLFEPEQEFQTKKGHLLCDKFVVQQEGFEAGHRYLKQVFSNRVDCNWIAQNSNRKWKRHLWPLLPKKFVIKFVRCNLSASYMQQTFQIPVIHILRNPYDTIHSQQRVKFPWLYNLSHFANQLPLVTLLHERFSFNIETWETLPDLEKLSLRWCIENVIPIAIQKAENKYYRVVTHEALRSNINVFLEICKDFNIVPVNNIANEYVKPSSKTHPKSHHRSAADESKKFTPSELQRINAILDTFAVDFYPRQHA